MKVSIATATRWMVFVICSLMFAGLARLSAQDVNTDYDHQYKFNMLKGYSWGKVQIADASMEPRVVAAIDHFMQQYGFKESGKTGAQAVDAPKESVMVVTVIEANDSQQYAAFYRRTSNLDWHRSWGSKGFSDSAATPRQLHGGTLIVDIYDGPSGKLVWRGTAAEGNAASGKETQSQINDEVAALFGRFPPKSGGPEVPNQVSVPSSPSSQGRNTPN